MKEGLQSAEDKEANVYEDRTENRASNCATVLGVLMSSHYGAAVSFEQRSDCGENDDGEEGHDDACPSIHRGNNGLHHDGRVVASVSLGGGWSIGGGGGGSASIAVS